MIRPPNFSNALRNIHFKKTFTNFLVKHWMNEEFAEIVGTKRLFVTLEEKCFVFELIDGKLEVDVDDTLLCYQEEAISRIMIHINNINPISNVNVVVRADDTDTLVILLGNYYLLNNNIHV